MNADNTDLTQIVIVDPKVTDFHETHVAPMIGYLNLTGLETALLFNFRPRWASTSPSDSMCLIAVFAQGRRCQIVKSRSVSIGFYLRSLRHLRLMSGSDCSRMRRIE